MEGKLIIEVYEYADDSAMPVFEYIPCELSKCMKGKSATLEEIIQRGFDNLPRKSVDSDKRQEILQKIADADIGRIEVMFNPAKGTNEPSVKLTNVVQVTITDADARRRQKNAENNIILKERYRLSAGNEVTTLKDAQRLTLTYSNFTENSDPYDTENSESPVEICLNITYLQE